MSRPRLLIVPLLAAMAACTSRTPEPRQADPATRSRPVETETETTSDAARQRLVSLVGERCRDHIAPAGTTERHGHV